MPTVFDCRKHNIITVGEESEPSVYLVVGYSNPLPVYDDLLINVTGSVLVFQHVVLQPEQYQFTARLLDTGMVINTMQTPSFRHLKRAILSQLKRDTK